MKKNVTRGTLILSVILAGVLGTLGGFLISESRPTVADNIAIWQEWNMALKATPSDAERITAARLALETLPKADINAINQYGNERYRRGINQGKSAGGVIRSE